MAEDRIAALEERLAAVERAVAALRATSRQPFVSTNPNDPLDGHPLISKKMSPEEAAALDAQIDRELGIEGIEPVRPEELRSMMIADGIDPNDNEFSRGIIEEREERG